MASKDLAGDLSDTHKQENSRAAISPCCSARRGWNVRPQPSCESREGTTGEREREERGSKGEEEGREGGTEGRRGGELLRILKDLIYVKHSSQ